MELSIQRLKVLGDIEIAKLDTLIQEYKMKSDPTVLDKDINQIRVQLKDMQTMYTDLQTEYNTKQLCLETLNKSVSEINLNYEQLESNIIIVDSRIKDVNETICKTTEKKDELNSRMANLKKELVAKEEELVNCKQSLNDLHKKFDFEKTIADKEQDKLSIAIYAVNESIKRLSYLYDISTRKNHKYCVSPKHDCDLRIAEIDKQIAQVKLTVQSQISLKFKELMEFTDSMNQIINTPITITTNAQDITLVFNEIVNSLTQIMSRNFMNYCIVRDWYRDMIDERWHGPKESIPKEEKNPIRINSALLADGKYILKEEDCNEIHKNTSYGATIFYFSTHKYNIDPLLHIHGFVCTDLTHKIDYNIKEPPTCRTPTPEYILTQNRPDCICKRPETHNNPDNYCMRRIKEYNEKIEEEREYNKVYPELKKKYDEDYKIWETSTRHGIVIANTLTHRFYRDKPCNKCKFTTLWYPPKIEHNNQCNYPPINLSPYNSWLRTHYKLILSNIIKNDRLSYVIQNTVSYDEINKLFADSRLFPMDSYNEFEFMLMLAFLGNDGKPHNLYDEIILNPKW